MSAFQRDYIERIIEQFAQAVAQIVAAVRAGDFDLALITVRRTSDLVLGNLGPAHGTPRCRQRCRPDR